jgi:competence protein CoiA
VTEFQHSYIRPEEREARENFYGNMIWMVNGRRTKYDFQRFDNWFSTPNWLTWTREGSQVRHKVWRDQEDWYLPKAWLNSTVNVLFDWGFVYAGPLDENTEQDQNGNWSSHFICLEPTRPEARFRFIYALNRKKFIRNSSLQSTTTTT